MNKVFTYQSLAPDKKKAFWQFVQARYPRFATFLTDLKTHPDRVFLTDYMIEWGYTNELTALQQRHPEHFPSLKDSKDVQEFDECFPGASQNILYRCPVPHEIVLELLYDKMMGKLET
jgi:hypothetical protein